MDLKINKNATKKEAIEIASTGGLYTLSSAMKNNKEVVMAAVSTHGNSICWASKKLQDDLEIIQTAIKTYPLAIKNASARIRDNIDIVREVSSIDHRCFDYASDRLKNNKELVIYLSQYTIKTAEMISYELQNDEEVCRAYISSHGFAIRWFSDRLRNDPKIMALAIENASENVFKYAGNELTDLVGEMPPKEALAAINLKAELEQSIQSKSIDRKKNKL